MPAPIYYENDADLSHLANRTVASMGYGSQGHAHALNLRDSGVTVVVGLREGSSSTAKAEAEGLPVLSIAEAAQRADVMMMALPDTEQASIYSEHIAPNLSAGNAIAFSHGFNIHFDQIQPPDDVDVWMIAPKGPGHNVRRTYAEGGGVPALVAIHQDATGNALNDALAYAKGIGGTRGGVLTTTFAEETETDLIGEQVVLCGGLTELIRAGYDTLVEAGYQPEIAYFEVMHELKLIVDLMYEGGMTYMRYSVSETVEYGDYSRGPRVVDPHVRANMEQVLAEIQDGTFAKEWIAGNHEGQPRFKAMREAGANHEIEKVGAQLRGMMSFLKKK